MSDTLKVSIEGNMSKYFPLLKQIKNKIDRAKVVSFDVFDTLLLRPYINPTDLFLHIEKVHESPNFFVSRTAAELKARRSNPDLEDITYDEIYEKIKPEFKSFKQIELDWEMMVLTQNPEMKQIWDYAKSAGKKIIVASDIYLPTNFIAKALNKNGFSDYDAIFVSGDLGKTKGSGTLYRHILDVMKIAPSEMLHIGDNKKSDYKKPKKYKIYSVRYRQLKQQYLQLHHKTNLFHDELSGNLGAGIFVMLLAMRWQRKMLGILKCDYFDDIGYEYGGPIAYGYSRWIESQVKKNDINQILFIARDGYLLQKVFDTFDGGIKSNYVYAPRFLNMIFKEDSLCDSRHAEAILEHYIAKNPNLKKSYQAAIRKKPTDYHLFVSENAKLIENIKKKEMMMYRDYLTRIVGDGKFCIVDTITYNFSGQQLIQNTLNRQALGLYWGILKSPFMGVFENRTFIKEIPNNFKEGVNVFTKKWEFIEFLLSSPEHPIKNISADGKPICDTMQNEWEKTRTKLYLSVSHSAILFAKDIKKMFGGNDIFLESSALIKWINCLCDNPTGIDIKKLSVLRHACDWEHKIYKPIFSTRIPLRFALSHPNRAFKEIKDTIWLSKLQMLALCLKSPVKIKMKKLRILRILFLPKLKMCVFSLVFRFGHNSFYQISIGNENEGQK